MSFDFHAEEKRIIGEVWTSQTLYAHLATLCDFGSRFGGTLSEAAARDWLLDQFARLGLRDVHPEPFTYMGWSRGTCAVRVVSPREQSLTSAISLVYSPSTPPGGLRAELIDVGMGTEEEFAARAGQLEGRIVMANSASPESGKVWIHRREKYGRAVAAGAAGFLFVNHLPGRLAPTGSLRSGRVAEIPAAGLCLEDGFQLSRWAKDGPVIVEMDIQNEAKPAEAVHVVGEVPGDPGREMIIVGAHYDGHDIAQGAMDDGTGVALVLELARLFVPLAGRLPRTIRFICFAVEELGVLGSTEYVRQHASDLADVALMLNLDGGVAGGLGGFSFSGFSELQPILQSWAEEMGADWKLEDTIGTATDAFPFVLAGIPALNMRSRGRDFKLGRGFGHTAADTLDKVQRRDLHDAAMTLARLLLRLATYEGRLARRRTRDEVKRMLIDHDLERPLRAQDKWPFD
ncbi:MAG: M28 family peptidase [Chloroflexi bacterium]|nr:M28 family peptidase [Chloroflexota bacterium]